MAFPSPIGGIPLPSELGPCILFIVLYACLLPLMVRGVLDRRSRTTATIGIMVFSTERIVVYTLRALQTRNEGLRLSGGLINYQQATFGIGYLRVGLSTDLLGALRCLLINPTYGPERYAESPAAATKDCYMEPPREGDVDRPRERSWARRFSLATLVLFFTAMVIDLVGNSTYSATFNNAENAERTYILRRVSTSIVLVGATALGSAAAWSYMRQPRAGKRGVITVGIVAILIAVIASYRLSATQHKTEALESMAPGSLNRTSEKVLFYIFQAAPEWLVSTILPKSPESRTGGPLADFLADLLVDGKCRRAPNHGQIAKRRSLSLPTA
ncbi:hypothetical protein BKA70DRAFT_672709 [Coprinopsis sp. MPI-PUGE-AT-0042]|nr:hypothetical protein BKA70DRAFT_672709 [Coprinopsis sp. MPI-PUGE-AT-0042]